MITSTTNPEHEGPIKTLTGDGLVRLEYSGQIGIRERDCWALYAATPTREPLFQRRTNERETAELDLIVEHGWHGVATVPKQERLRLARLRSGLSLGPAAELLGLSREQLGALEHGRASASDEEWKRIFSKLADAANTGDA